MTPADQFEQFLSKYTPEIADQAQQMLAKLRQIVPPSNEMVYDNYNGLVLGFSPTDRPSDAVLSIQLQPSWVNLCFLFGATLHDPHRILSGEGSQVRTLRVHTADKLDEPEVAELITQAIGTSRVKFKEDAERTLIIRSVSEKQRPRRPK